MIIKQVYWTGLEMINDCLKEKIHGTTPFFGSHINNVLSHCSILMELENVTELDLFMLKKLTKKLYDVKETDHINFFDQQNEPDAYDNLQKLLILHSEIKKDTDIPNDIDINQILPIGSVIYSCKVRFTGNDILFILGSPVNKFFQINKFDSTSDKRDISNSIIRNFINSYYSYAVSSLDIVDSLSDYAMYVHYYNTLSSENKIIAEQVDYPIGNIKFLSTSEDDLTLSLMKYKENKKNFPNVITDDNTIISIGVMSTISTFMKIATITDFVSDHEDFKVLLGKSYIESSGILVDKYGRRVTEPTQKLFEIRDKFKELEHKRMLTYSLITNGQPICYSLKIPVSECKNIEEIIPINGIQEIDILNKMIYNVLNVILSNI